ncbi:hypothetical protein AB4Z21_35390, partial [Paenibacillus sp. MCAF20]
ILIQITFMDLNPDNIYGPESYEILKRIQTTKTISIEVIYDFLTQVFKKEYDPEGRFNKSEVEQLEVARQIYNIAFKPNNNIL